MRGKGAAAIAIFLIDCFISCRAVSACDSPLTRPLCGPPLPRKLAKATLLGEGWGEGVSKTAASI